MNKDKISARSLQMKRSTYWQVLVLIANHLDPKTIAVASCVCKSWAVTMSSDHIWQPICTTCYPSISNLRTANATVPYRQLYALGHVSDTRRHQKPRKPHLSLQDLIFAVEIRNNSSCVATIVKHGDELELDKNGVFRFDIDVDNDTESVSFEALDSLKVTWNVVLKGFDGVFTMMDCKGRGSSVLGLEGWLSKELPSPGCCSSGGAASGMVADLRLGLRESCGKVVVGKLSVGVLSVISWRYVCVDDALRYLQHFLLPSDM